MIRVLHLIDSLDLGGAQTALLNMVRFSDAEQFEVEVAAMHGRGVFWEAFERLGVKMHSLSAKRWPPAYVWNLARLVRTGQFDVVHCHLFGANWVGKPVAAICGARRIFNHDQCNDAWRTGNPLCLLLDAVTNRLSAHIFTASESTRRVLMDKEFLDGAKITTLYNGIDLEALDRVRAITREGARRVLGLPEGGFVVAGIGRLVPQKNFQLFLRVAALLAEGNAGVTFVIFGDGPLRGELGREAERLGLGARVRFVPFVEDRATLYRSVDVLLVTSDFEGLPMTVAEAMACGVPVVASRLDGIAELFEHGKHALLVSPGDASRFASHVGAMLADVALRESLAAEAQDLVGKRLDARQTVRAIEEVYLRGGLGGKKCEV